ncbi:MAG TPA: phosphorylase [Saprospiraceae bacterium]|nr:phosphorylase [Saprospiraceae bacterium]
MTKNTDQYIIPASELPINADGSIYHLNLQPGQIADTILTVGDPGRVKEVSKYFDEIEWKTSKREFHTHTGRIGKKRITVVSTGIGPDNIDIVLNEMDALANINFKSRTIKKRHKQLTFIRLGTSGTPHSDIPVDSLVISEHGLGFDNVMHFYEHKMSRKNSYLLKKIHQHLAEKKAHLPLPYLTEAHPDLVRAFESLGFKGITATCPGFYGPQGRRLRLKPVAIIPDVLQDFKYKNHRITNFEMETSAIFGLSALMGHRALAVNTILANRADGTFTKRYKASVKDMIKAALERIESL